jgi:DNA-binding PadR family transcriptional regulator
VSRGLGSLQRLILEIADAGPFTVRDVQMATTDESTGHQRSIQRALVRLEEQGLLEALYSGEPGGGYIWRRVGDERVERARSLARLTEPVEDFVTEQGPLTEAEVDGLVVLLEHGVDVIRARRAAQPRDTDHR